MDARQLDHVAVDLERAAGLSHHKTSMQQQQPLSPSKVLVVPQRRANVSNHMPTVGTALHISRAVMYVPELKSKRSDGLADAEESQVSPPEPLYRGDDLLPAVGCEKQLQGCAF
ncbi:unnamed protein product [Lampetra planeri]